MMSVDTSSLRRAYSLYRVLGFAQLVILATCLLSASALAQTTAQATGQPTAPSPSGGIQPIPAAPANGPSASSNQAGNQSIGQKIDLLTLKDLENRLQATPDPIFMMLSRTYQMTLLSSIKSEMTTAGPITADGTDKTHE